MKIKLLRHGFAPIRATEGSCGIDILSPYEFKLPAGRKVDLSLGFKIQLDPGTGLLLIPRSGIGSNGLNLRNTVGLIDEDYRGEVSLLMVNNGSMSLNIRKKERIAQGIVLNICKPSIEIVKELDDTERGDGGFGSTGRV